MLTSAQSSWHSLSRLSLCPINTPHSPAFIPRYCTRSHRPWGAEAHGPLALVPSTSSSQLHVSTRTLAHAPTRPHTHQQVMGHSDAPPRRVLTEWGIPPHPGEPLALPHCSPVGCPTHRRPPAHGVSTPPRPRTGPTRHPVPTPPLQRAIFPPHNLHDLNPVPSLSRRQPDPARSLPATPAGPAGPNRPRAASAAPTRPHSAATPATTAYPCCSGPDHAASAAPTRPPSAATPATTANVCCPSPRRAIPVTPPGPCTAPITTDPARTHHRGLPRPRCARNPHRPGHI